MADMPLEKFMCAFRAAKGELMRKCVHVGSGVAISCLYTVYEKRLIALGLLLLLSIIIALEMLRLKGIISIALLRKEEQNTIGGHAFFILGTLFSIVLFKREIAIASILMLSFGDSVAGMIQALKGAFVFSKKAHRLRIKPLDMIIIMFGTSFLTGYVMINSMTIAVLGAIGATIADGVYIRVYRFTINDNLTIPLYSGFMMSLGTF